MVAVKGHHVSHGVISPQVCDALLAYVHKTRAAALSSGDESAFGKIRAPENRYDLLLDLDGPVPLAMNQLVEGLRESLTPLVGENASLVELAAITSEPGAEAQPVHADTVHGVVRFLQADVKMPGFEEEEEEEDDDRQAVLSAVATDTAPLWSCLTVLQDVTSDMGPTLVWPGTNTVEAHSDVYAHHSTPGAGKLTPEAADALLGVRHEEMLLPKGGSVCYDSRLMHCGGANTGSKSRTVLVVTFMGAGVPPEGSTYDLRRHLRGRLKLRDFPLQWADEQVGAPVEGVPCSKVPLLPPPPPDTRKDRAVPVLEEWEAAVQCVRCKQWRPCAGCDAAALTIAQWRCGDGGFACTTPQGYSVEEIDSWLES
eukprot:Hpha_TRINITY_DN15501_c4_g7::TRINITY_DN15501_c4_g7_i1::g.105576::m.105576